MATSFEKSVKGATKVKLAAPKSKYVEHILVATHAGEAGIAEVFRALNNRVKDQTWTIVFKSLIIVHLMIREGEQEVTLRYLRKHPRLITVSHYSDAQEQGRNIRHYSQYLLERARTYGDVKTDYVRSGEGRLRKLSIEKGLLREVECVQTQIRALLKCTFLETDVDNEISLLAFRLLVMDLLVLFHVVNEGVINVLEHYFEMSRIDAERGLEIYKTFTKQTADVVEYLQQARSVETATRLQIPNLKHAPTSLTSSLEEYLQDPEFDSNRRNYLATQEAKRTGKPTPATAKPSSPPPPKATDTQGFPASTAPRAAELQVPTAELDATAPRAVAPDLIDFFESIESEQTPMFGNQQDVSQMQNQYAQQPDAAFMAGQSSFMAQQQFHTQTGAAYPMVYQAQNPYAQAQQVPAPMIQAGSPQQVQTNFTGAGFGGYTPSDQTAVSAPPMPTLPHQYSQQTSTFTPPHNSPTLSLSTGHTGQTDTNPFRQSMMMTGSVASNQSVSSYATSPPAQKSTNPFARAVSQASPTSLTASAPAFPISTQSTSSYNPQSQQSMPLSQQPTVRSMPTGTNPFARNLAVSPNLTGSSAASAALSIPSTTGGTNPFRQSMMVQQQQQQQQAQMNGNFSGQTGSMGGWENLETIPIFPRTNNSG